MAIRNNPIRNAANIATATKATATISDRANDVGNISIKTIAELKADTAITSHGTKAIAFGPNPEPAIAKLIEKSASELMIVATKQITQALQNGGSGIATDETALATTPTV